MIDETIQAYRDGRLSDLDSTQRVEALLELLRNGEGEGQPAALIGQRDAFAYYGVLTSYIEPPAEWMVDVALQAQAAINQRKIRDWVGNPDVENQMKRDLDNLLYDPLRTAGIRLSDERLMALIEAIIMVARKRDGL